MKLLKSKGVLLPILSITPFVVQGVMTSELELKAKRGANYDKY